MISSVFTLYELSNGDDTEGEGMIPYLKLNFIIIMIICNHCLEEQIQNLQ